MSDEKQKHNVISQQIKVKGEQNKPGLILCHFVLSVLPKGEQAWSLLGMLYCICC